MMDELIHATKKDVIIIGAEPIGLSLAASLERMILDYLSGCPNVATSLIAKVTSCF